MPFERRSFPVKRWPGPPVLSVALCLIGLALAGCSSPSSTTTTATGSSTLTVAGSTAMLPLVLEASGEFQRMHPTVKISVSGGGSAAGIAQVAARAIDIGDSDILAVGHPELVDSRVAVVGFAVIANPSVHVKSLSRAQLRDVFSGKITNWRAVGGADQKIVVVNRARSSGTRAVFAKVIMGTTPLYEGGLVEDSTGTAVGVVRSTPGAVSYVALSGISGPGVTIVAVDGVAPSKATIVSGRYPIWSYEHMYTYGPPKGEAARFIAFVRGATDLVKKNKFITVSEMHVTENDR
jgi:phosphate transport system substrate-binding protein